MRRLGVLIFYHLDWNIILPKVIGQYLNHDAVSAYTKIEMLAVEMRL